MHKFLLMIAALLLIGSVHAHAAEPTTDEGDGKEDEEVEEEEPYVCIDDGPRAGAHCWCDSTRDCDFMARDLVCDGPLECTDLLCSCDWVPFDLGGTSQRPDGFDPSSENAPTSDPQRPGGPAAPNFNPPSRLAVGGATSTSLTLTWRDNSNSEVGFIIEQLDHMTAATGFSVSWSVVATIRNLRGAESTGAGPRSHTMRNLRPDTTNYCYRVRAFRGSDTSSDTTNPTEAACATTLEVVN